MLDTIKLGIPISRSQYEKLEKVIAQDDSWQWVQFCSKTGDLRFIRYKGLMKMDQQSFRREIYWDIPEYFDESGSYISLEFSVPKYWYGHNIHLLYDYVFALNELKKLLQRQLYLKLPKVDDWKVFRADICYAWRCPSQRIAERVLDSIKRLHFPRKNPIIYQDSILFSGTTYSLKFYLKLPEFIAHDRKELLKANAKLEWVNYLEKKADGVLRCEATLRKKYLERNGIKTVADLSSSNTFFRNDDEIKENYPDIDNSPAINTYTTMCILKYMDSNVDIQTHVELDIKGNPSITLGIKGDLVVTMLTKEYTFYAPECDVYFLDATHHFKGGGFSTIIQPKTQEILNKIIEKLLGEHKGMNDIDSVREKLLETYKQAKASRLLGFWLFVQKLGSKQAKEDFGHNSYYVAKRDLKKAGVSLIEPVKIINTSDKFIKDFKIELPSSYTTNQFDDFRNSDNILNLPISL